MNENPAAQQWNPMLSNPGDDFADFLDLGDLNFSYFPEENAELAETGEGAERNGEETMDHAMEESVGLLGIGGHDPDSHTGQQTLSNDFLTNTPTVSYNTGPPPYGPYAQNTQHSGRPHEHHQQQWVAPNMVPPTPSSMELQAGHAPHYPAGLDMQQQQIYEHYRRIQKDQVNFTPLISPAVTPLETQARYHEYSNDAFSPLTSPALRAQNHAIGHSSYGSVRGSDTSATTSPHDLNYEYQAPTSASATSSVRRSRRKMSASSAKTPARAVKQSPAMKPQHKKKQTSSTVIPPKEVATVLEEATAGTRPDHPPYTSNGNLSIGDGSMTESMSPEALSDILMPPPATPQSSSAGRSPQLDPMANLSKVRDDQGEEPATPASLMRLRKQAQQASTRRRGLSKSKQRDAPALDKDESMEGVELSGSSTSENQEGYAPSAVLPNGKNLASRGSRPTSVPVSASTTAVPSALPSPITSAFASPLTFKPSKHPDNNSKSREPKKRSNAPSEKASPAIRPRISPSIKPLLPEGSPSPASPLHARTCANNLTAASVSPETSALLLASKSNYQNILEGTHFPGVSYPENLSTNLTSKRTSHKIAEQGRRNRINTALQDIAALLPATSPTTKPIEPVSENKTKGMSAAAVAQQQQSNSKASTVEAAIDYIKALQQEVKDCKVRLAEMEANGSPLASEMAANAEKADD